MSGLTGIFMLVVIIVGSVVATTVYFKISDVVKECHVNSDCRDNSYCGSDFNCHACPEVSVVRFDFVIPALIFGLCVVLAALILKKKQQRPPYW